MDEQNKKSGSGFTKKIAISLILFILFAFISFFVYLFIFYSRNPVGFFNMLYDLGVVTTVSSKSIKYDTPFFYDLTAEKPKFYIKYQNSDESGVNLVSKQAEIVTPPFSSEIKQIDIESEAIKTFKLNVEIDGIANTVLIDKDKTHTYWNEQVFIKNPQMGKYNTYMLESVNVDNDSDGEGNYDNRGKNGLMNVGYGYTYLKAGDVVNLVWEVPGGEKFGFGKSVIKILSSTPVGEITVYR